MTPRDLNEAWAVRARLTALSLRLEPSDPAAAAELESAARAIGSALLGAEYLLKRDAELIAQIEQGAQ